MLKSVLFPPGADSREVLNLLQLELGDSWSSSSDWVHYGNPQLPVLAIRFEAGAVAEVVPTPHWTSEVQDRIVQRLHNELLRTDGADVVYDTLFAAIPVTGAFCSESLGLRILELPPSAPRVEAFRGPHPFAIAVKVSQSASRVVTLQRGWRQSCWWAKVINALLFARIERPTVSRSVWVPSPDRSRPIWTQTNYWLPDGGSELANRPLSSYTSIPTIPENAYYGVWFTPWTGTLKLPDTFESLLGCVLSLSEADKRRFERCVHWLSVADTLDHQTTSFAVMVTAIESLIESMGIGAACLLCKRSTGPGPTAQFRQFFADHLPERDFDCATKEFYQLRSQAVHGKLVFADDLDFGDWTAPDRMLQIQANHAIGRLVRAAVVNWLKLRT